MVRLAIPASFTCSTTSMGPLPVLNLPLNTHRPPQLPHRSSGVGSRLDLNSSTSSILVPTSTLPHRDMSFHTPTHSYMLPLQQHAPHSTAGNHIASPDTAHHHRLVPQLSHRHLNLSPSPLTSFMSPDATISLTRLRSNSRLAESDDSGEHESTSEDHLTTHRTGFSDIFS